jgi:hypothetical protein
MTVDKIAITLLGTAQPNWPLIVSHPTLIDERWLKAPTGAGLRTADFELCWAQAWKLLKVKPREKQRTKHLHPSI